MVVRKIYSPHDLKEVDHYSKFSPQTRKKIQDAIHNLEETVEKYEGLIQPGMLKGTIATQLEEVRPLIKSDLEAHAKNAERTAEFEKEEEKKLYTVGSALLIASGLIFMATNFNPAVALAGVLLSGIVYLEALFCGGRALAKKDEAQFLMEYDVEAG